MAFLALQYFSTLSHKRRDFQGQKEIEHKICTLITSRNLPETFLVKEELSHKRRDFRGKKFEPKICTLITSRNLSETFLVK
jgi:hypothetical protein